MKNPVSKTGSRDMKNEILTGLLKEGLIKAQSKHSFIAERVVKVYKELKAFNDHISADDLWAKLHKRGNVFSIATVYKYLNFLTLLGFVERTRNTYKPDLFRIIETNQ
ncbi:hypothetical protein GCM10023149_07400 [Mucilaginibacter gynuensis]|uniref:Ferric uptake regulator family protein n=1 Tax=Mucilaginibacter gynuensis TaxID=1302236 RepID=A0ABP8FWF1_9SPHI